MKTSTIGNVITIGITGASIGLCILFPNPLAIMSIVGIGSVSAVTTQVFTMKSRNQREYERNIDKEFLKVENTQSAVYIPQKEYQKMHSNTQKATFKGEHKTKTDFISEHKNNNKTKQRLWCYYKCWH